MEDLKRPLPPRTATLTGPVGASVTIAWDSWGIPHVRARTHRDVCFGLGYATAQEHLWRLEYCRRQARGTLAAVLGKSAVTSDRTMRLLGLGRHADATWKDEPAQVVTALQGFSDGVNAWREHAIHESMLPVECVLLGFAPEAWTPADSVATWKSRWWSLTGRLDNIAMAEAARRHLPPELLNAFMATELGEETILPGGKGGSVSGGADTGEGSNNWVVAGSRTTTGYPVLCSDPHNPFTQPSQWFEAQLALEDGSIDVAGAVYIGAPAVYFGRNRRVAWGFTNHVAPQRDLYLEDPNLNHGDRSEEMIEVKDGQAEHLEIRRTPRGPVVNVLLPDLGAVEPPISLRWTGTEVGSGLNALLELNAASTAREAVDAMAGWVSPIANLLVADVDGHIAYHAVGKVPGRVEAKRGYRSASDPVDSWDGFVPYDSLPHMEDPDRGWIATANQPPWSADPPGISYLAGGAWADGGRMRRIATLIEGAKKHTPEALGAIQADVFSERACELVPALAALLAKPSPLEGWDFRYTLDSVPATIWAAFWDQWLRRVTSARFPERVVGLVTAQAGAVARDLLLGHDTTPSWFGDRAVAREATAALEDALTFLTERVGPDQAQWQWGKLHTVSWRHAISDAGPAAVREAVSQTLDVGPFPTTGGNTVRAAGYSTARPYRVTGGATYRLLADLSPGGGLWTVSTTGQSGHPGSPHYADQAPLWVEDRYHAFPMDAFEPQGVTTITPSNAPIIA